MTSTTKRLYPELDVYDLQRPSLQHERKGRRHSDDSNSPAEEDEDGLSENEEQKLESHSRSDVRKRRTQSPYRDGRKSGNENEFSWTQFRESPDQKDICRSRERLSPVTLVKSRIPALYSDDASFTTGMLYALIIISVLVIIVLIFLWFGNGHRGDKESVKTSLSDLFDNDLRSLKKTFPNQQHRLWSTISSSIKNVLDRYSTNADLKADLPRERSPSVILFLGDDDSIVHSTLACLVTKLSNITGTILSDRKKATTNFLDIDGRDFEYTTEPPVDFKYLLEKKLSGYLSTTGTIPVVVLRNIHMLPPEAAMILHAYCDNENAPFKDSVFFLTADCESPDGLQLDDQTIPATSAKNVRNWDAMAEHCLRNQWLERRGLTADKIAPLMSRIANSAVFVLPEKDIHC